MYLLLPFAWQVPTKAPTQGGRLDFQSPRNLAFTKKRDELVHFHSTPKRRLETANVARSTSHRNVRHAIVRKINGQTYVAGPNPLLPLEAC